MNIEVACDLKRYAFLDEVIRKFKILGDDPVELLLRDSRSVEVSLEKEEPYRLGCGYDGVPTSSRKGNCLPASFKSPFS